MGTTLTALQAGSTSYKFVVAIEGYEKLLTDATAAQAMAAWSGSDHSGALEGLFVDLENEQQLNPWEPLGRGGRCKLTIVPDAADTFGIVTHRRNAGDETMLTVTIDRDDATATVKSTTNFDASGDVHCGTECIGYTGKTATTFTGLDRGKYSPFARSGDSMFAQHHRAGFTATSPKLEPLITQYPRHWTDRWVGVWVHRNAGGVLDTKAQAQLVFAGKIVSVNQDPGSLGTVIELRHVLDVISERTVGRDIWRAKIKTGVRLTSDMVFRMRDNDGATALTANILDVMPSGAAGANQVNAGFYSHSQLHGIINGWLSAEAAAGRLHGTYEMSQWMVSAGQIRTRIQWRITAAGSPPEVLFNLVVPEPVATFLGFDIVATSGGSLIRDYGPEAQLLTRYSESPPHHTIYNPGPLISGLAVQIDEERGEFWDNLDYLPARLKPNQSNPDLGSADYKWGVFLIDGKLLVSGAYFNDGSSPVELQHLYPTHYMFGGSGLTVAELQAYEAQAPADETSVASVSVQQIVAIEQTEAQAWKRFLYSTGTLAYNHATHDVFPVGLGLAIPHDLLGDGDSDTPLFCYSADSLPGANTTIVSLIDREIKFTELLGSELVARWSFLRWKNGHLELASWKTPTAETIVASLTEANKAVPVGNKDDHRTPSSESTAWQRSVVKIQYNRDITDAANEDGFRSSFTVQDQVAIDDAGGEARPATLKMRNTYAQEVQTGAGIEGLIPDFIAGFPMFSRPVILMSRSISPTLFEGLSVGDAVLLTDEWARDPETGQLGTTARPAIVVRHWYNFGGRAPNAEKPNAMGGGVDLMLLPTNRAAAYVPCAQVDDTAANAGYNALGPTLTCYTHKHSDTAFENSDVSNFVAGDRVRIIEIDPPDPAAPLSWDREVLIVAGDTITLTATLSAPAWDATKKYRVIFDDYGDCQASQQLKCFQADDADGMIANAATPRQYTRGWPDGKGNADAVSDPVELLPNAASGDGVGRDVGHDLALSRLIRNFIDRKSCISSPWLTSTIISSSTASVYLLVECSPIFLTEEGLSGSVRRTLTVSPWFRSGLAVPVTVRVTLSAFPPTGDSFEDVERGAIYDEASWSTSSTTWQTGTPTDLDIGTVKPSSGICWLLVEITQATEYRGLARCSENERTYV